MRTCLYLRIFKYVFLGSCISCLTSLAYGTVTPRHLNLIRFRKVVVLCWRTVSCSYGLSASFSYHPAVTPRDLPASFNVSCGKQGVILLAWPTVWTWSVRQIRRYCGYWLSVRGERAEIVASGPTYICVGREDIIRALLFPSCWNVVFSFLFPLSINVLIVLGQFLR